MAESRIPLNAAAFVRGPRFYEHEGEVMFVHQLDSRSSIGPRPATQDDFDKHPDAYAQMGELPATPLGARVEVVAEAEPPPADLARPYAERRKRAEA